MKMLNSTVNSCSPYFQHCHIWLILHKDHKIRNTGQIDRIISAEIPDARRNQKLFDIITKNQIHGPCGSLNKSSPCMTEGPDGQKTCKRSYPKDFNNHETSFNDASYPDYLRRDVIHGGHCFSLKLNGKDVTVDNSMVVPYNPKLSLIFNAHINVELVQDVGAVKYLYKYVTKGSDKAVFTVVEENAVIDEIDKFQTGRFVGASEAFWRIYGFDIGVMKPSVFKLALHLENEQTVLFSDDDVEETVAEGPPKTHLTEFFELVRKDDAAALSYPDVCRHYTWNATKKEWIKRKRNTCFGDAENEQLSDMVGRIPIVNFTPKQSELFFLRMLLYSKKGPKSFADLRTVNNVIYETYQLACKHSGLLENEEAIEWAMKEGADIHSGWRLRRLFATLLIHRRPSDPLSIWEQYLTPMCDDIRKGRNGKEINDADCAKALSEIQALLRDHHLDLEKDFRITPPQTSEYQADTADEYDINTLKSIHTENCNKLTEEQTNVYDKVLDSVNNDKGRCFVLDAPGGTGKTFLLTTIIAALRKDRKEVIAAALSGLAATLLPDGRTVHSGLKVPLDIEEFSTCSVAPRDAIAEKFRNCKLLIIDEISMGHKFIFEAIDRTMRDIRSNDKLFGNLTVILSGDWRQILPVVRRGSRAETVAACFKNSYLWPKTTSLSLSKNLRLIDNESDFSKKFLELLMKIGNGTAECDDSGYIQIDPQFLLKNNTLKGLCDYVFDNLLENFRDSIGLCRRSILCPKNDEVAEVNNEMTERFPGHENEYLSADKVLDESSMHQYPPELLHTINYEMPPHKLILKIGCPIMLLRNLDPKRGHCNGTRYVITHMHQHLIDATVISGLNVGAKKLIPRIPIIPNEKVISFRMQRVQFPVKPAFAMTINKSQGQSLERVGLYLKTDVFTHGQLYVAMSRCTKPQELRICHPSNKDDIPRMKNVVYREVLGETNI